MALGVWVVGLVGFARGRFGREEAKRCRVKNSS